MASVDGSNGMPSNTEQAAAITFLKMGKITQVTEKEGSQTIPPQKKHTCLTPTKTFLIFAINRLILKQLVSIMVGMLEK